jgi:hypothetical protein
MAEARVIQASLSAAVADEPGANVAAAAALVAYTAAELAQARVAQGAMMAAYSNEPAADVSQAAIMVAYQTGVPGLFRSRAWTFDFDGHVFYVLNLGTQGTFLFDTTTGQWSKFDTGGYGIWNMLRGITWGQYTIGADALVPVTWKLDPYSPLDEEWRPIEHIVTAMIPRRTRTGLNNDSFTLTVSAGYNGNDDAEVRFRFSDDNARTWRATYYTTLRQGDYAQDLEWTSLGVIQAPGRVFEVRDVGGFIRIDDAGADLNGIDNDAGT